MQITFFVRMVPSELSPRRVIDEIFRPSNNRLFLTEGELAKVYGSMISAARRRGIEDLFYEPSSKSIETVSECIAGELDMEKAMARELLLHALKSHGFWAVLDRSRYQRKVNYVNRIN